MKKTFCIFTIIKTLKHSEEFVWGVLLINMNELTYSIMESFAITFLQT